jgi:TonB family protein
MHAVAVFFAGGPGPLHRARGEVMIDARLAPAKATVLASRQEAESGDSLLVQRDVGSTASALAKRHVKYHALPLSVERKSLRVDEAAAEPVVLALSVDPTYYSAKQLDIAPKPLGDPSCPAEKTGVAGRLILQVMIDESGKVTDALIDQPGPNGMRDEACLGYYRTLRFIPGMKDGQAARSKSRFELTFGAQEAAN